MPCAYLLPWPVPTADAPHPPSTWKNAHLSQHTYCINKLTQRGMRVRQILLGSSHSRSCVRLELCGGTSRP